MGNEDVEYFDWCDRYFIWVEDINITTPDSWHSTNWSIKEVK